MRISNSRLLIGALVVGLGSAGCSKEQAPKQDPATARPTAPGKAPATGGAPPAEKAAEAAKKLSAPATKRPVLTVATILASAPAGVTALGTIDARGLFDLIGSDVEALFPGMIDPAALRSDLGAVLKARLGTDLLDAQPMVVFYRPSDVAAAAWIPGLTGLTRTQGVVEVEPHGDTSVYELGAGLLLAEVGGGVAVGNRAGVVAAVDVAKGKAPNAGSHPPTARLGALLEALAGSSVRIAAIGDELLQQAGGAIAKAGVTTVGFGVTSGTTLRFVFGGPAEARQKLQQGITVARSLLQGAISSRRQRLEKEGGLGETLLAVIGDHVVRGLHAATAIEQTGELVAVDLKLGTIVVPLMAVLGVTVVPSFAAGGRGPMGILESKRSTAPEPPPKKPEAPAPPGSPPPAGP